MTALTIAGFDPSSGAGITADLAVFAAHGVFGISAITALTIQSTTGVRGVHPVDPIALADTLACLQADLPPEGIKIGMLGGAPQARAVAHYLQSLRRTATVVLDPVLRSTSGAALLSPEGTEILQAELLPLADVVTPNSDELALLTGMPCGTLPQMQAAAESLASRHPALSIVCTNGSRARPDDLLLHRGTWTVLAGEHIATRATHGTGCAFSSALLSNLLAGHTHRRAATEAKLYVAQAMRTAVPRGAGHGPMHLLWPLATHPPA